MWLVSLSVYPVCTDADSLLKQAKHICRNEKWTKRNTHTSNEKENIQSIIRTHTRMYTHPYEPHSHSESSNPFTLANSLFICWTMCASVQFAFYLTPNRKPSTETTLFYCWLFSFFHLFIFFLSFQFTFDKCTFYASSFKSHSVHTCTASTDDLFTRTHSIPFNSTPVSTENGQHVCTLSLHRN